MAILGSFLASTFCKIIKQIHNNSFLIQNIRKRANSIEAKQFFFAIISRKKIDLLFQIVYSQQMIKTLYYLKIQKIHFIPHKKWIT